MSEYSKPSDPRRAFFVPSLPPKFQDYLGGVFGPGRVWLCQAIGTAGVCLFNQGKELREFLLDAETLGLGVEVFPQVVDSDPQSPEVLQQIRVQQLLQKGEGNFWIASLVDSLDQTLESFSELLRWPADEEGPSRNELLDFLSAENYIRKDLIESPGQMCPRGGLVDVWLLSSDRPYRFDYFGDTLESVHAFDPVTQRRQEKLREVTYRAKEARQDLWTTLVPTSWPIVWMDAEPTESDFLSSRQILAQIFGDPRWDTTSTDSLSGRFQDRLHQLNRLSAQGSIHLFFDTEEGQNQFRESFLSESESDSLNSKISLHLGRLSQGIRMGSRVFLNAHILFGKTPVRKNQSKKGKRTEKFLTDLKEGDLVVHVNHGIARYRGMKILKKNDVANEFMALEFSDRTWLYVPATQTDLVQRYVGAGPQKPDLSKLGGRRWEQQKNKVMEAVGDLAHELIERQAKRKKMPGISFPPLDDVQMAFARSFPHEETPDQIEALGEIEYDMISSAPMDRLLCGDVGYGKTELALRAAFKAVCGGKQVAVLAPTTVLVEQHRRTFEQRLHDFPITVDSLSRLSTAKESRRILEAIETGHLDIVIGTHRLLGDKVNFLNLGLVIIDEEQRFGVAHKEASKNWRVDVDLLTLTATPIPRTLHMALLGLRDISNLTTPPVDRLSVATRVLENNDESLKRALKRELARGGQAFVLHNRVKTLKSRAEKIRMLLPSARIITAHGQMSGDELESVMLQVVRHEVDVLVCTTIIGSGVDIPNVNTIVVDEAQRFGLAELHQLRGRVGRSDRKGYALLFLPLHGKMNENAKKRLQAMEEYTDLGAGFQIAMRDLEIRGAGNIIGSHQSGHIVSVGYELYCQLLDEAVAKERGQGRESKEPVQVDLPIAAYIPEDWIGSNQEKVIALRRLLQEKTIKGIQDLEDEFLDRFGSFPEPFKNLINVLKLKIVLRSLDVTSVSLTTEGLSIFCRRLDRLDEKLKTFPGKCWTLDGAQVVLQPYAGKFSALDYVKHLLLACDVAVTT